MPESHNFNAHFAFLGRHGEHSLSRDTGNETGGSGKGHRIDLGACNHELTLGLVTMTSLERTEMGWD
jgi:hypothetical protein